ncbi:virB8 family protein [Roseibaca calidilacus]|jgi:type IV secretion system protein VirB8|uniref:Type IV secretion system protein VirB8 n=1 Tax=Roseibaca calidilacus TaxID=1666912 RepID=A0ABM9VQI8_9RHOB|nr:type IV secretion system protein [Roseibaca calidilacus]CUX79976.1 type IV secretion system protein VirB8 [Roseibaca calidilacus]
MRGFRRKPQAIPDIGETVTEELVFGALRRERLWQIIALSATGFGIVMGLGMMVVAMKHEMPTPQLVPFDTSTGAAVPWAEVRAISLDEEQAVADAMVFAYVRDRETFNQLDNDQRVRSVMSRSTGDAANTMRSLWSSANPNYPPERYGSARMDVEIISIAPLPGNRAQIRLRKRLRSKEGDQIGNFTVTLAYEFEPAEVREIADVWANPFGFKVREYAITSDRFE